MTLAAADLALVDRWQRGFPLVERPFAVVGESVGLDAAATIERLRSLLAAGAMSRIGAVVRPRSVGASTLAAMQVPIRHLDEVAAIVSAEPLVNHNYQREHDLNLWFVVAGGEGGAVATTLERISSRAGLPVVDLPLLQAYHLDLGFSLRDRRGDRAVAMRPAPDYRADARDRAVLAAIEDGLPLVERPYRAVGRAADLGEAEVIDRLAHLAATGVISRFGCIVRHRAFGYVANAMTVWNVPDGIADSIAASFVGNPRVTLCYRRPRRPPRWPYNLFCMVHAKARHEALATIEDLNARAGTAALDQAVLFSTRCFKQRGAVFSDRSREPNR